ncbi:hypothetical protein IFO69_06990 [Echinicola sp. CAU 1574]|uniref:Uncharacterized protein n=1 Tax=Echinicola arenosa TaxID=2774144 RepID=A0ABR9AI20_9BACT|nr:hypothetical protein [Echinicola arenosa]MBD8488487.1 hypothetical protein [Echinicola arenosa]
MYENSVGHNSTLILGITPDDNGLVPVKDANRMKEFGDEVKRIYASPIAETSGTGKKLMLKLETGEVINHVVLQEDIRFGERIRAFVLEGKVNGKWKEIYTGSSIGHKHIIVLEDMEVDGLRLMIKESKGEPVI